MTLTQQGSSQQYPTSYTSSFRRLTQVQLASPLQLKTGSDEHANEQRGLWTTGYGGRDEASSAFVTRHLQSSSTPMIFTSTLPRSPGAQVSRPNRVELWEHPEEAGATATLENPCRAISLWAGQSQHFRCIDEVVATCSVLL